MAQWYRSLYWRIALTFLLCLAAILVVQGVLFVWVASRAGPPVPGQLPTQLARTVADDLAQSLQREKSLDVEAYLRSQYGRVAIPLFVVFADGRSFSNGSGAVPASLLEAARARLRVSELGNGGGPSAFGPAPFRPDDAASDRRPGSGAAPAGGRGERMGFRPPRPWPIVVDDRVVGMVVAPPRAPFGFLLRQYAPTLALVAVGALVVGATLAAVVVFGPARRRLRAVEEAAHRLGRGDLTARVPAQGGDEVAAVAKAFNTMAQDLAARADALDRSNRMRRQLLADVSHELTTPVTAMRGYLETLAMPELALDSDVRARYLAIVTDETGRLERIIGDLLDLARLEDGGGAFSAEVVSLAQLLSRAAARHQREADQAGVRLTTHVDLGAETTMADAGRLEQALQNLTANALRYAPSGTSVRLRARPVPDGVAVTVDDEGPGIDAAHLPHVFDRFYKVDRSRTRSTGPDLRLPASGSGLGLSIVKAIVERHRGQIAVTSSPGHTTFELTLPRLTTGTGSTAA